MDIKLENNNLKEQIKYLAAIQGITMTKLKEKVNAKYNKKDSTRNLGNKFRNGTFRVSELVEILDVLDYDIYIQKRAD